MPTQEELLAVLAQGQQLIAQQIYGVRQALVAERAPDLPTHYAGKLITYRIPYRMPGELMVVNNTGGNQFPPATFIHAVDKPFECRGVQINIVPFESAQTPVGAPSSNQIAVLASEPNTQRALDKFIRLMVEHSSPNERGFKANHVVEDLLEFNSRCWYWKDPMTVEKSAGWVVTADSILPATFTINNVIFDRVRVDISFFGDLLVCERASETR